MNMLVSEGFQEVLSYISNNVQIVRLSNEMFFFCTFLFITDKLIVLSVKENLQNLHRSLKTALSHVNGI